MTQPPPTDAVRASALELLASGNSFESVVHVFGVPVETLRALISHQASRSAAVEPVRSKPERPWLSFPTTTTYRLGPMGRCAAIALTLLIMGCPVLAWPFVSEEPTRTSSLLLFFLGTALCLGLAACVTILGRNTRFELRAHAIAKYGLSGVTILPYAQITGLTATRNGKSASYAITLQTPPGTPSMTINPEDAHLRDPDLATWLTSIPLVAGDPIRFPDDAAAEPSGAVRVLSWFANAILALSLLLFLRIPMDTARAVFSGYPPLEQLSVTEGSLTRVVSCYRPRRGTSYILVDVRTDTGTQRERLGCILDSSVFTSPGPHHITIWRDTRHFSENAARQVELDGRMLQDYARFIARSRRFDPAFLVWQLMMTAMLGFLAYGFFRAKRQDD